jgi:folylpolyglutamate synthase/dihydropteroate synthase
MKKVRLLFGVLTDKNYKEMVATLEPLVESGWVVRVPSDRSTDPKTIATLPGWKGKLKFDDRVSRALKVLKNEKSTLPVVVTGSLYLVGAVRKLLKKGWTI